MNTIQDAIRELRAAGYSQGWIAKKLDISQPTISRWQAGAVSDAAEAAFRLAGLLADARSDKCSHAGM